MVRGLDSPDPRVAPILFKPVDTGRMALSQSNTSESTTESWKRNSARSLFEEYGIARPSGWLTDEEDLTLSSDGIADPRVRYRICHVCFAHTWRSLCSSCGHRLCEKCHCGTPQRNGPHYAPPSAADESIPAVREVSTLQKSSGEHELMEQAHICSFQQDRIAPAQSTQSKKECPFSYTNQGSGGKASQSPVVGDKVDIPSQSMGQQGHIDYRGVRAYNDPLRRTTQEGHYPCRYSIACASQRTLGNEGEGGSPRVPPLQYHQHGQARALRQTNVSTPASGRQSARDTGLGAGKSSLRSRPSTEYVKPSQPPKVPPGQHIDRHERVRQGTRVTDSINTKDLKHKSTQSSAHVQKLGGGGITTPVKQTATNSAFRGESAPSSRVFSPPCWLKYPSKQAGDAFSRLRHVETKSHGDFSDMRAQAVKGAEIKPKNVVHRTESSRNLYSRVSDCGFAIDKPSGAPPPVALHVTQHQTPELWTDSRADFKSTSQTTHQSPANLKPGPSALATTSARSQRPKAQRDPSSQSLMLPASTLSRRSLDALRQESRPKQEQYIQGPACTGAYQHSPLLTEYMVHEGLPWEENREGETNQASSRLPISPNYDASATPACRYRSQERSQERGIPVFDKASDLELCQPDPILLPNHYCSWKDRYMELTSEIRMLKAEVSTRAAMMGEEVPQFARGEGAATLAEDQEDDIGLEGVTIVMRMRDKDDLVIDADLTYDWESTDDDGSGI